MSQMLVPLSADPSRSQLRDAIKALTLLSKCGVAGAKDQLQAVNTLVRMKYPRQTMRADNAPVSRRRGRRGKKRGLITARDCMGRCESCRGKKGWMTPNYCIICPNCHGTGVAPVGAVEYDKSDTLIRGKATRGKALRGDFARQDGVSLHSCRGGVGHKRGYAAGKLITSPKRDAELNEFEMRCHRGMDAIDVAVCLEAEARRVMTDEEQGLDWQPGRQLASSGGRDLSTLCEGQGQGRLTRTTRTLRRYQSALNRERARERKRTEAEDGTVKVPSFAKAVNLLRKLGVSVEGLIPSAPRTMDSPLIAQARRRGDLPADDLLEPVPDLCMVQVLAGPHKGQTGTYTIAMLNAAVVRSDGTFDSHSHAARVEFADGSFDLFHPDDLAVAGT